MLCSRVSNFLIIGKIREILAVATGFFLKDLFLEVDESNLFQMVSHNPMVVGHQIQLGGHD